MNNKIKSKPTVTNAQAVIAPIRPQLLSVLRIPLLRGRICDGLEVQRQAHVAVVKSGFLEAIPQWMLIQLEIAFAYRSSTIGIHLWRLLTRQLEGRQF